MKAVILIFLGGGLGATFRHFLNVFITGAQGDSKFPLGILACNIIGSFLIGVMYSVQKTHNIDWLSPLLITGFLGGFTTFSTYALDAHKHFDTGAHLTAITYLLASVLGGLAAVYFGVKLAR